MPVRGGRGRRQPVFVLRTAVLAERTFTHPSKGSRVRVKIDKIEFFARGLNKTRFVFVAPFWCESSLDSHNMMAP